MDQLKLVGIELAKVFWNHQKSQQSRLPEDSLTQNVGADPGELKFCFHLDKKTTLMGL